jgi:hypothetical protein
MACSCKNQWINTSHILDWMIEGIHSKGRKVFVETLAIRIRNPKEEKK